MMLSTSLSTPALIRSPRRGESVDNYLLRLKRARLTKPEHAEINAIYQRLDAEWQAAGRPVPVHRASWTQEDILEWREMTPHERWLDLRGMAVLADRYALATQATVTAAKTAPAGKLICEGTHVGRDTFWESPFKIGRDGNQTEVIAKYERWLAQQRHMLRALPQLAGQKRCTCGGDRHAAHADLLFELAAKTRDDLIAWWRATK